MKPLRILLTNDDGVDSELLPPLKEILQKYGTVRTIVPARQKSGTGVAVTLFEPIDMTTLQDGTIVLDGTPADCVSYGLSLPDEHFDLVVSGPNDGHNITYDIIHSGTIGACVEAALYGKPAIALSLPVHEKTMLRWIDPVLKWIFDHDLLRERCILNVNFPFGDVMKGIRLAPTIMRPDRRWFSSPAAGKIMSCRACPASDGLAKDSDVWLIEHGFIVVTPLEGSYFHQSLYERIKKITG